MSQFDLCARKPIASGEPVMVRVDLVEEDPGSPRTEFPEPEIEELADDIRRHGVLPPIRRSPGRSRRPEPHVRSACAQRCGPLSPKRPWGTLRRVPQVAENQKRRGLLPLDLALFILGRVSAGDSNVMVAKRLGLDQTTVAHHLALLSLPPVLSYGLASGRCKSPRTLCELDRLHAGQPERVISLAQSNDEITRQKVAEPIPTHDEAPAPPIRWMRSPRLRSKGLRPGPADRNTTSL